MVQTLVEKLELKDQKTLLIQGLPSSIEKQFCKLSFAKSMTPLLKSRKIDFALVFAINANQLNGILKDVMPALKNDSKFWIAFPKRASKIVTDLNRESSFSELVDAGYEEVSQVDLDHVWNACCFEQPEKTTVKVKRKSNALQEA